MLVRFWGTRGSLPVAATASIVQDKVAHALLAAHGESEMRRDGPVAAPRAAE